MDSQRHAPTMEPANKLLLLKCAPDVSDDEVQGIRSLCALHGVEVQVVDKSNGGDIAGITAGACFSLVYVAGHGNFESVGPSSGACQSWSELALELCHAACIQPGGVVFSACCHGGLKTAAKAFFDSCPNVESLCGPKGTVYPQTLLLGFHVLMYNLLFRNGGPEQARNLAQEATGHAFNLYSQQAYLAEIALTSP